MQYWALFYGICSTTTLFVAWRSGVIEVQKTAAVLFSGWAISNLVVAYLGFAMTPFVMPPLDLGWGLYCCFLYRGCHQTWLRTVIVLFAAALSAHLAYHIHNVFLGKTDDYMYFASLNVIFLLQLLVVGTEGVRHVRICWGSYLARLLGRIAQGATKGGSK